MAKGWKVVGSNALELTHMETTRETLRKEWRNFDIIRHTPKSTDEEATKKEIRELYEKRQADNAQLIQAYNDKKLKSKKLVKRARHLIKKQEERKKRAEAKAAKEKEIVSQA